MIGDPLFFLSWSSKLAFGQFDHCRCFSFLVNKIRFFHVSTLLVEVSYSGITGHVIIHSSDCSKLLGTISRGNSSDYFGT